jgi:hypothetical protein
VGSAHFNIDLPLLPEKVASMLVDANRRRKESSEAREEYARILKGLVHITDYPVMTHELAHALQAITYPALFNRCLAEMASMCEVVKMLRASPDSFTVPLEGNLSWANVLEVQRESVSLSFDAAGGLRAGSTAKKAKLITAGDLMEDGATIFQYRAEIGSDGTAKSYRRWLNERYRYSQTFDFVSEVLGPEDAYVALPAIVMAAHGTVSPLGGFLTLLQWAARQRRGLPRELGVVGYLAELESVLGATLDEVGQMSERELVPGVNLRLQGHIVLECADTIPLHPLSPVVKRAWSDGESIRKLRETMLKPWMAFSRYSREEEEWFRPYLPPVTAFRVIKDERFSLTDSALEISPTLVAGNPDMSELEIKAHMIMLFRLKAFVLSAATPYARALDHNCPHTSCEWHRLDMCRTWLEIPGRHEDCEFPKWLERQVRRKFDFDAEQLVPPTPTKGV